MTDLKPTVEVQEPLAGALPEAAAAPVEEPTTPRKERLDPTRYGDWELNGKCVDF